VASIFATQQVVDKLKQILNTKSKKNSITKLTKKLFRAAVQYRSLSNAAWKAVASITFAKN